MKKLYRTIVPLSIRKALWDLRNLWSHAFSDQLPAQWEFDYETYWEQRLKERGDNISYPEFVQITSNIITGGVRILDIGCGAGTFLLELGDLKRISGVGVDISQKAIEIARMNGVEAYVSDASKDDLSELGEFEIITCFEVLEHIPNSEVLLRNILSWFPDADVIVSIPNTGYIASRFRLLMGRFPKQWHIHPSEHLRYWTLRDFRVMVEGMGYKVLQILPVRGFPTLARWRPSLFSTALVFHLRANAY